MRFKKQFVKYYIPKMRWNIKMLYTFSQLKQSLLFTSFEMIKGVKK